MARQYRRKYRLGGELVDGENIAAWHHERGLPWGPDYGGGPQPVTVRLMVPPTNLAVHLANEHGAGPDPGNEARAHQHLMAHLRAEFRQGQEHYHRPLPAQAECDGHCACHNDVQFTRCLDGCGCKPPPEKEDG